MSSLEHVVGQCQEEVKTGHVLALEADDIQPIDQPEVIGPVPHGRSDGVPANRGPEIDAMDSVEVCADIRPQDTVVATRTLQRRPLQQFVRTDAVFLEVMAQKSVGADVLIAQRTAPNCAVNLVTMDVQLAGSKPERALGTQRRLVRLQRRARVPAVLVGAAVLEFRVGAVGRSRRLAADSLWTASALQTISAAPGRAARSPRTTGAEYATSCQSEIARRIMLLPPIEGYRGGKAGGPGSGAHYTSGGSPTHKRRRLPGFRAGGLSLKFVASSSARRCGGP